MSKCFSCGIESNKLEASGMWHCPNPRCTGSGAAWFRRNLKSFKEVGAFNHTVDPNELEYAAGLYEKSREIFDQIYGAST